MMSARLNPEEQDCMHRSQEGMSGWAGVETSFNATKARAAVANARSLNGTYLQHETKLVLDLIKTRATRGECTVSSESTNEIIIERLKALGYTVTLYKGDQRDPPTIQITW